MAEPLVLVLGGARSGKSTFALELARDSGRRVVFIASATAGDADMAARIARHRAERPADWTTVEEPTALASAVRQAAGAGDVVIVDCLTLWVSNVLCAEANVPTDIDERLQAATIELLQAIRAAGCAAILVSNEVGLGVVPATELGRQYRDLLGRVNATVASAADHAFLLVAGQPIDLKALAATHRDVALRQFRRANGG